MQRASKDCLVLKNSEGTARANADGERFQAEGSREFRRLEGPIPSTDEALAEACRAIGAEMDAIEIWNQEKAGAIGPRPPHPSHELPEFPISVYRAFAVVRAHLPTLIGQELGTKPTLAEILLATN